MVKPGTHAYLGQRSNAETALVSVVLPHAEAPPQTGALPSAIGISAHSARIATAANHILRIFNVGAERVLACAAAARGEEA